MTSTGTHARAEVPDALITVVDRFVPAGECRRMLDEAMHGEWVRSAVEAPRGHALTDGGRRSDALLLPSYSEWAAAWLRRTERRLATLLQVDPARLEPWQMVRYRRGGFYDYHIDCGAWSRHPSGERARTVLIVLQEPVRGGATHFRALARSIRPATGRLIAWRNLLSTGRCNHAMIHSGRPVWQGCKTILTTWERQRPYVDR